MSKLNISDAALKLGVSKEAIHNRIRRGSLQSVFEDNVKYVILNDDIKTANKQVQKRTNLKVDHKSDLRYYKLLEEQNQRLQLRVEILEGETKILREQKEEILVQERVRIEQIYKDKDEQLKNILNALSSKFMLSTPEKEHIANDNELLEAEIEQQEPALSEVISLKKYLKKNNYSKNKRKSIINRFKKISKKDSRIIIKDKKYYIDIVKYDYADLLH